MAEEASAIPKSTAEEKPVDAQEDMELVEPESSPNPADSEPNGAEKADENGAKRGREEAEGAGDGASKKAKTDRSVEEERLEKAEGKEGGEEESKEAAEKVVRIGPKEFGSSVEMFDYFYNFLHFWPPNIDVNKYEHMVLLDLLKQGHTESDKKIGEGIQAFQVRYHPMWKSRCFFLVRVDGSTDDFSFRKCVDHILPLPENMKIPAASNKSHGGQQKGGGRGGRGGGGRGGRGRGRRGGFGK